MDAGDDSSKTCPLCVANESCCGNTCVDLNNNPEHCGDCVTKCDASKPLCLLGKCVVPPCGGQACNTMQICCGAQCCDKSNQICCVSGAVTAPYCFTPTNAEPTCPP